MAQPQPSEITSRAPLAEFTRALVQPPSRVYLFRDDRLYIRSRNSLAGVVLNVRVRLLRPDGVISYSSFAHIPAADRTVAFEPFNLAEGFLLSAVVFPSAGAPLRGQTFVELGLLRGAGGQGDVVDVLVKDYVAESEPIGFPGSPVVSAVAGAGARRVVAGADPAAGVEWSITVPTDARWRFIALRVLLVNDATVASRVPVFVFDDGANEFYNVAAQIALVASQTGSYSIGGGQGSAQSVGTSMTLPAPQDFYLGAGFRIRSNTSNLQAGDNWTAPQALIEEWLED
jgi:hypothetical protein